MTGPWLVIGSAGQLGADLVELLTGAGEEVLGLDLPDIDITSRASVAGALAESDPSVVVNCAAYTDVDGAESDEEFASRVNAEGPKNLAEAVRARPGTRLVQISTDYVFDGSAAVPYAEEAAPAPRSAYGRTKLAGERAVLSTLPERGFVVRTAWLYGENGQNFVKTMLRLESERPVVNVVDDQVGQPTWSRDLAAQVIEMMGRGVPPGIYHGTSSGRTSWFDFTREIYRLIGADPGRVRPTSTAAFPRPAERPAFSVLGHDAWTTVGMTAIRDWQEALAEALPSLRQ